MAQILDILCYLIGYPDVDIFTVKLHNTYFVYSLKEVIVGHPEMAPFKLRPKDVKLWKASVPLDCDPAKNVEEVRNGPPLMPRITVADLYPEGTLGTELIFIEIIGTSS